MTDAQENRHFTLHVDFLAADIDQARSQAATYTEWLNQLRPEVDGYRACISLAGAWSESTAVFCTASGLDATDICTDTAGHAGCHHGPGGRWGG
jgi:Tfp pilus assembly protein FimT